MNAAPALDELVYTEQIPGATEGPCWAQLGTSMCRGRTYYPPPGWTGQARTRCTSVIAHEAIVSHIPMSHTDPDDVVMTEAERRLLTELLLEDDREAGLVQPERPS